MHKDPIAYLLVPADRPEDLAKCSISYQLLTELHRSRYEKFPIKIDFHKGNLTTKVFFQIINTFGAASIRVRFFQASKSWSTPLSEVPSVKSCCVCALQLCILRHRYWKILQSLNCFSIMIMKILRM